MLQPPGPDILRDDFGRPLVEPPGGGGRIAYQRATTFSGALDAGAGLADWKLRHAVHNISQRPDLILAAATADPNEKPRQRGGRSELGKIVDKVLEPADAAANTGTALHSLTEKLDRCEKLGAVPEPFAADLKAYEAATAGIEWAAVEAFRVYDPWRLAGTADRIGFFRGQLVIADIKTGSISYPTKFALQLAIYAHSVPYDTSTDTRGAAETGLDLTRALIIHLAAGQGRCTLHWIDIEKGWELCHLAKQVWDARGVRGLLKPVGPATTFADRARIAADIEVLRDVWRDAKRHNAITPDFTAACGKRREQLTATQ
jgi:hypothetical protein